MSRSPYCNTPKSRGGMLGFGEEDRESRITKVTDICIFSHFDDELMTGDVVQLVQGTLPPRRGPPADPGQCHLDEMIWPKFDILHLIDW